MEEENRLIKMISEEILDNFKRRNKKEFDIGDLSKMIINSLNKHGVESFQSNNNIDKEDDGDNM